MEILWIVGYVLVAMLSRFLDQLIVGDYNENSPTKGLRIFFAAIWPMGMPFMCLVMGYIGLYNYLQEYPINTTMPSYGPVALAEKLRKHLQSKKKYKVQREVDAEELAAYEGL